MPKRPQQHQTAAKAETAVRSLWVDGGHAVDTIREDYGEDLLVQTCLMGRVDASRIWVQVKGTAKDCSDEKSSLPALYVNAEQVLRWSRSSDLVIVVLWDVNNKLGWYVIPDGKFNHVSLSEAGAGKVPVIFDRSRRFDESAVEYLSWLARIDHVDRTVAYSLSALNDAPEGEEGSVPAYVSHHQAVIASAIHQFANDVGIFSPDGEMSMDFKSALSDGVKEVDGDDYEQLLGRAIMWAILKVTYDKCAGNGLPATLLIELTASVKYVTFGETFGSVGATE